MQNKEIFGHVDHTALKPCTTWKEVEKLCHEAIDGGAATVCIPPSYVKRVKQRFGGGLRVCTVIGFPLGYSTTQVKACEAHCAVQDGADEIDMVVNLGMVKDGEYGAVRDEIAEVKGSCDGRPLKVIVETCYLTEGEKEAVCNAVREAGAEYIKTSTGFGTGGAAMEDILLFKRCLDGSGVKIKASGGIKTRTDMEAFLAAGCERLGTSSAAAVLAGNEVFEQY